jgi:hypothetical protein
VRIGLTTSNELSDAFSYQFGLRREENLLTQAIARARIFSAKRKWLDAPGA